MHSDLLDPLSRHSLSSCVTIVRQMCANIDCVKIRLSYNLLDSHFYSDHVSSAESSRSDRPLIPYLSYPINPDTGAPVSNRLSPLEGSTELALSAPIPDPDSGLHVPIQAVTIHPQSGALLPVGGSHIDPITRLPVAIEIGSMMIDPVSSKVVPIMAVALDEHSGKLVQSIDI